MNREARREDMRQARRFSRELRQRLGWWQRLMRLSALGR